jgi:hypothetical protein
MVYQKIADIIADWTDRHFKKIPESTQAEEP